MTLNEQATHRSNSDILAFDKQHKRFVNNISSVLNNNHQFYLTNFMQNCFRVVPLDTTNIAYKTSENLETCSEMFWRLNLR